MRDSTISPTSHEQYKEEASMQVVVENYIEVDDVFSLPIT